MKSRTRKIAVARAGAAGNVAGTVVGSMYGGRGASRLGAGIGTGLGATAGWAATRPRSKQVATVQASTGAKDFKKRVGTKTNGRVAVKDHPYM